MSAAISQLEATPFPIDFAIADEYGGPLRASIAMQMVASGNVRALPDPSYVDALARRATPNSPDDLDTVVGAALSYRDMGNHVLFMGEPKQLGTTHEWLEQLADYKYGEVIKRAPTAKTIAQLIHDNWSIVLHARGEAFERHDVPVHPVFIVSKANSQFVAHNPGSNDMEARSNQRLSLRAALGTVATSDRVSLLAVRQRAASTGSVTINRH